jgi:ATP-dependent protease ClpP protease subunit
MACRNDIGHIWSTFLPLLAYSSIAGAGSVSSRGPNDIIIDGEIDSSTLAEFNALARKTGGWGIVMLNSPGGDLDSAIAIGRIVRAQNLETDVPNWATCASACIFILCAGVDRSAFGRIGIHRPHYSNDYFAGLGPEEARKKYEQLESMTRDYLHEVGMPDSLFVSMMRVSSDKIQWLSNESIHNFGLDGIDPAYDEWLRAAYTQKFGPNGYRRHYEASVLIGRCLSRHDEICTRKVLDDYPEFSWDPRRR